MTVYAIHRDPFTVAPNVVRLERGLSLTAMVDEVKTLPDGWPRHEHDCITVNGTVIPRGVWPMVRPKDGVEVGFHAPPMGGGGSGGKQILSLVASVALVALSGGITSGALLGNLTGAAAAGKATFLSRLLGAGVLIAGSAAISALSPTPSIPQADTDSTSEVGTASANGNRLEPNTPFPRVVGTRKVFPPYLAGPLAYYDGQDEVVEAVVGLGGPHTLTDIRIGGAEIEEMTGVEYETREGWAGQDAISLVRRYSRTTATRSELRGHVVRDDAPTSLDAGLGNIDTALPQPKTLGTRGSPDEYWIDVSFPQGVFLNSDPDQPLRVPFRLRMREKGTESWINLPELHFAAAHVGEKRAAIRLRWRDEDLVAASAEPSRGWVEGRITSAGQAVSPTTTTRTAHSSFDRGSGADYVTSSNTGSTAVQNLIMSGTEANIYLNENEIPRGRYEIEIVRGYAFENRDYSASGYTIGGSVRDPFYYEGGGSIYQSKDGLSDVAYVVRGISVWNERPVQKGDVALIAVKARNVSIDDLSVVAAGYVKDWDGSEWDNWTTTSNPAPHMRDILGGMLNALPVPEDIIDDTGLVAWRTACTSAGYTVDAICEGLSVDEAMRLVAGAGYAKPYQSEIYGVLRDYDRSAEGPAQVFSPHNMSNFKWSKGFARLPDGFRISFADADEDYETRQIIHPENAKLTEQVEYSGLVSEADCRARADYDLATTQKRSTFYDFDAPAEAIKCRRGSLIEVTHDMLTEYAGSGRITDIEYDASGDVVAVTLDNEQPRFGNLWWDEIEADDWADIDFASVGVFGGVILRGKAITSHACTIDGSRIELTTAATIEDLRLDDLAIVGPATTEALRLIVFDMAPRDDMTWTITAVDEAPDVWT